MSKYHPLTSHLKKLSRSKRRLSFREIENVLGFKLPPSARRSRAWWSNNPRNSVMTKAWLAAGWKTEQVDMERETLVFSPCEVPAHAGLAIGEGIASPIGGLRGTVTILGPIESTGEKWSAEDGVL